MLENFCFLFFLFVVIGPFYYYFVNLILSTYKQTNKKKTKKTKKQKKKKKERKGRKVSTNTITLSLRWRRTGYNQGYQKQALCNKFVNTFRRKCSTQVCIIFYQNYKIGSYPLIKSS